MAEDSEHNPKVEALVARGPGEDPEDPYADVDVSQLPDWWQRAIEKFESHGLRPYRPPRFEDGSLKHEVVADLESRLGVTIKLLGLNVQYGDDWVVRVDGESVSRVPRRRDPAGYTVFEVESDEFVELIEDYVKGDSRRSQ